MAHLRGAMCRRVQRRLSPEPARHPSAPCPPPPTTAVSGAICRGSAHGPCCWPGVEGAVQAFLSEDRFSRALGDSTPSSLARTPVDPTAVTVSPTPSRLILLLEAPSHPPLFRASHGPVRSPGQPLPSCLTGGEAEEGCGDLPRLFSLRQSGS